MKKLTKEQFIKRAREVHGDKYDYSKIDNVKWDTPLPIVCPIHGEFKQTVNNHLHGKGCKECGKKVRSEKRRLTKEEFIKRAREIHGNKYDYSKVKYVDSHTSVCIICPKHGEFYQTPNKHISTKHGCPKCAKSGIKLTTEEFIEKAREVHGNRYDYSKTVYVNEKTKVNVICKKHGEFTILPSNHYSKDNPLGCPVCNQSNKITTEIFIKKAIDVHGDKYDYSKVKYKGIEDKVCIICYKHGEFWQKAHHHLQGSGCPSCNERKLERETRLFLSENNIKYEFQKRFDWLGLQSLDFYLSDYNIAIECQGIQHFKPVDYAGLGKEWAKKQLLLNQSRDKKKKELCEENGVKLCYVNYDDDIEERLLQILKSI